MAIHGLRESSDIDIHVTEEVYEKLKESSWESEQGVGQIVLRYDVFDVGKFWDGNSVEALLKSAVYVDDVPFLGLLNLRSWKTAKGRPKDKRDIVLIDKYFENNPV